MSKTRYPLDKLRSEFFNSNPPFSNMLMSIIPIENYIGLYNFIFNDESILLFTILPFDIIEKYKYRINWIKLSEYHKFSLKQIEEYREFIDATTLLKNKYIDKSIKDRIEFGVFYG